MEDVTIAILAKDKAHCLDVYLKCVHSQTFPKKNINLYIRTNNNNDDTAEILAEWIEKHKSEYKEIFFDDSDVPEKVQSFTPHEWNSLRFKVLGKIRQDSIEWAKEKNSHYLVIDCDNFITPDCLEELYKSEKPVIGPLLRGQGFYANYHYNITHDGYCADSGRENYKEVLFGVKKGLIEVPVIHCTYFIRKEYLKDVVYDDNSGRYEYVIFSDNLRKKNIPQYLDNRKYYGFLTFEDTREGLMKDPRILPFVE